MAYLLDDNIIAFPDPHLADPNGLLAVGGALTPEWLLLAYSYGIFPWFSFRLCKQPKWYCPPKRYVIFPEKIHVSHSMRTLLNKHRYRVTVDNNFDAVIKACSTVDCRDFEYGAWLGRDIIDAYTELHRMGYVHSVEVHDTADNDRLVGGLYGVAIGHGFYGESMFSLVPNGSKIALIALARMLKNSPVKLIDCQFHTPLFESMGAEYIDYDQYLEIISGDNH